VQFSGSRNVNTATSYMPRQQQQQQQQLGLPDAKAAHVSSSGTLPPLSAAAAAAANAGFEDAYLDPPMPSSDQLSLFSEVQRLIGRKRLQPVLHCVLQRMVFAMPFDERLKITLDTDVAISAVVRGGSMLFVCCCCWWLTVICVVAMLVTSLQCI
jgi:hypothetical protein